MSHKQQRLSLVTTHSEQLSEGLVTEGVSGVFTGVGQ